TRPSCCRARVRIAVLGGPEDTLGREEESRLPLVREISQDYLYDVRYSPRSRWPQHFLGSEAGGPVLGNRFPADGVFVTAPAALGARSHYCAVERGSPPRLWRFRS